MQNRVNPAFRKANFDTVKSGGSATYKSQSDVTAIDPQNSNDSIDSFSLNMNQPNGPNTIKDIMNSPRVAGLTKNMEWKKEIVQLHPYSFNIQSMRAFLKHKFGGAKALSNKVRNHDERMVNYPRP